MGHFVLVHHWDSTRLWAGGMRVLVLRLSQLMCLGVTHSLREPGAGRCHGRLEWDGREQNKDLTRLVRRVVSMKKKSH